MNRLRRVIRDLDLIVGIGLAVTVAVLGTVGVVQPGVLSAATLFVLALLVAIFFRVREQLRRVEVAARGSQEELQSLAAVAARPTSPSDVFRYEYPDLGTAIETAREVWVVAGGSLRTSVGSYLHQFQQAVDRGAVIRLVCPDPTDDMLMEQLALSQRVRRVDAADNTRSQLALASRLGTGGGDCVVKVAPFLPTLGLVKVVGRDGGNEMYVKLLPFSYVSGAAPVCVVTPGRDNKLYEILDSVLSRTWESCRPWE